MRRVVALRSLAIVLAAAPLAACASWGVLPSTVETTESPFQTYQSAEDAFNKVRPFVTTAKELKVRGFNPYTTPNIKVLNYLDLVPRFLPQQSMKHEDLDPAVQSCLTARDRCTGWLAEPSTSSKDRTGNVALDVLGFEKETTSTGWKASMLLLIQDGVVVYKLWSGTPTILEVKTEKKPLGPFQDLSGAASSAVTGAIKP
ncbi:MAG: hypothetical protein ABL996_15720 [Micropepsaceae bacterium]